MLNQIPMSFLPWRLEAVVRVDEETADLLKEPLRRTDVGQVFADHEIEEEAVDPGKVHECVRELNLQ